MDNGFIAGQQAVKTEAPRIKEGPSAITPVQPSRKRFAGIFTRRDRWGLSWRGWLLLLSVSVALGSGLTLSIHPFLSVTDRVDADLIVMEGWVHDHAVQGAIAEYKNGGYKEIFVTGGPVRGVGEYPNDYDTLAHVGAGRLKMLGMPANAVQMIPSGVIGRDRTYHSAVALREWFRQHGRNVRGLNIVTENVHARRTRLLFGEAFGPKVAIGIIAVPDPDYNSRRWWRYSDGVREVVGETIAYLYAKLFFHPLGTSP